MEINSLSLRMVFLSSVVMLQVIVEAIESDGTLCESPCCAIIVWFGITIIAIAVWDIILHDKIKESLDTLPVGVAFSDVNGHPYLVNYRIDKISREFWLW